MMVQTDIPLLEELLEGQREVLGSGRTGYRNHCFRVFNFCSTLSGANESEKDKIAIAAVFHDLGIWTHHTFDYLLPSQSLACDYLTGSGRSSWADEVLAMIGNHHKITSYRAESGGLIEAFRRADWIDVSLGWLRFGLTRSFVRETLSVFPNAGFHRFLLAQTWRRTKTHPLSPLPMMRL
jgi:hypothetical protein